MTGPSGIPLVAEAEGHIAPLYPYAEHLGAKAVLIARCDDVTAAGDVVQIVLEQYGWRVLTSVAAPTASVGWVWRSMPSQRPAGADPPSPKQSESGGASRWPVCMKEPSCQAQ